MRPPPEVLLLPSDATVGQLLEAATAAFRAAYRMCANWTAEAVVAGLSVAVPPPTQQQAAVVPALPAPVSADAPAAGQSIGDGAAPMDVDGVDPSSPEAVAAATAAAAVSAAVAGTDGPTAGGGAAEPAAAAAGDDPERLAAQLSAAAISAAVAAQDGQPPAAQQAQQNGERQALLARRLADLLLPAEQQQQQEADGAPASGAGGSAEAARAAATNGLQLPSVTVAGRGIDWSVRWRHAGGCGCGARFDCMVSTPAAAMLALR